MRIYIAGPMTGLKDYHNAKFDATEEIFENLGFEVVNPARIARQLAEKNNVPIEQLSRASIMRADLKALTYCDAIYLLKGWEKAKGSVTEHAAAVEMGLKVILEGAKIDKS